MKNPGSAWYEKDERYHSRNLDPLKKPERNHREFLRDLPVRGGKLLDVGMGTGNFLAAAAGVGYEGYGIDFDRDAIEVAERIFGLKNVFVRTLPETVAQFPKFFNVVTAFEVVEHLENPGEFLEQAKRLLRDEGCLAISVPYRNCPVFLKPFDLPPRHLTRWNKEAMQNFLEAHGFQVIRMKVIPVSLGYLITKFHFWTRSWTSMNLVAKVAVTSQGVLSRNQDKKISFLRRLARTKDYILFFVPALLLALWLLLIAKNGLGLYVLAKRS